MEKETINLRLNTIVIEAANATQYGQTLNSRAIIMALHKIEAQIKAIKLILVQP